MENNLREKIVDANLKLHQEEAKYYDLIHAEIYSKSEQKLINTILHQALKILDRDKIRALDVGAGTGNITLKLLNINKIIHIRAIDLSREMLDQLQLKLKHDEKVELINSDIDSFLKHDRQFYDLITISSVLHHLPDYFQTIDELMNRLTPKGVMLIFHEPSGNKSNFLKLLSWLDSRLFVNLCLVKEVKKTVKTLDHSYSDYHAYHTFDLVGLRRLFVSNKNLEIFYFKEHNVFAMAVIRWLAKFIPTKNNFILGIKKII